MRTVALVLCSAMLAASAWASQPGQPIDCTDWVAVDDPDLRCRVIADCTFDPGSSNACEFGSLDFGLPLVDSTGRLVGLRHTEIPSGCGRTLYRRELIAAGATGDETLGYFEDRCATADTADLMSLSRYGFDLVNGRLILSLSSYCTGDGDCPYAARGTVIVIHGFPALKDFLPRE